MDKHLTHKEIADYFSEIHDAGRNENIRRHLDSCDKCSLMYKTLLSYQKPLYRSRAAVSDNVRKRILESYDQIKNRHGDRQSVFTALTRIITPARAAAAGFAAVVIAVSLFIINENYVMTPSEKLFFSITEHHGEVLINDKAVTPDSRVSAGNLVRVSGNSYAVLSYGNNIHVKIFSSSILSVEKAELTKTADDVDLVFFLKRGSLISSIPHGAIQYQYRTPLATIDSRGTRFLVHASPEKTTVYMKEGSVKINSSLTQQETVTSEENKYTITDVITEEPLNESDKLTYTILNRISRSTPVIDKMDSVINSFERNESLSLEVLNEFVNTIDGDTEQKVLPKEESREKPRKTTVKEENIAGEDSPEREMNIHDTPSPSEKSEEDKKREIRENMKELQEMRRSRRGIRSR